MIQSLLPSEVARLVYGYLLEKCPGLSETFLQSSPDLQECRELKKRNRSFMTTINGKTLEQILDGPTPHVIAEDNPPVFAEDNIQIHDNEDIQAVLCKSRVCKPATTHSPVKRIQRSTSSKKNSQQKQDKNQMIYSPSNSENILLKSNKPPVKYESSNKYTTLPKEDESLHNANNNSTHEPPKSNKHTTLPIGNTSLHNANNSTHEPPKTLDETINLMNDQVLEYPKNVSPQKSDLRLGKCTSLNKSAPFLDYNNLCPEPATQSITNSTTPKKEEPHFNLVLEVCDEVCLYEKKARRTTVKRQHDKNETESISSPKLKVQKRSLFSPEKTSK